jgi:NADH-quinone oxidoreductase subunit C
VSDAAASPSTPSAPDAGPRDAVTAAAARLLAAKVPGAVLEAVETGRHPSLRIAPEQLVEVARALRDDPDLAMDCCHLVTGVDWPAKTPAEGPGAIEVLYHLVSYTRKPNATYRRSAVKNDGFLVLRVRVPRDRPEVPSVMGVWVGADWHERETWDLVGVRFTGRGPLRRILLPEDWPGHPLRKDWAYPVEYHGIPIIPPEGR